MKVSIDQAIKVTQISFRCTSTFPRAQSKSQHRPANKRHPVSFRCTSTFRGLSPKVKVSIDWPIKGAQVSFRCISTFQRLPPKVNHQYRPANEWARLLNLVFVAHLRSKGSRPKWITILNQPIERIQVSFRCTSTKYSRSCLGEVKRGEVRNATNSSVRNQPANKI